MHKPFIYLNILTYVLVANSGILIHYFVYLQCSPKTTNKYETIDEYQAEIKEVIKFLEELKEEDFINKNAEYSSLYFEQWKKLVWKNIFYFFLPNMFFHMTTAYDIVRHFGFDVGKADFLWRATFDLFE